MRKYIFIIGFFLLLPAIVLADIYQWTDSAGVLHITDDMDKIPAEYREKITTMETDSAVKGVKVPGVKIKSPQKPKDSEQELYGDHPLSWWRLSFYRLHSEIDAAKKELTQKGKYVDLFERRRRKAAGFAPGDLETYEKYSAEILQINKRLKGLEDKLTALSSSARRNGVPKKVRK